MLKIGLTISLMIGPGAPGFLSVIRVAMVKFTNQVRKLILTIV